MKSYLRLKIMSEEYIGGLDVSMDDPSLATLVQVMQSSCTSQSNLVPQLPLQWRTALIYIDLTVEVKLIITFEL